MKKQSLFFLLLFAIGINGFSQTKAISYQAVITDPYTQEIPGVNLQAELLTNRSVGIKFTITDDTGNIEYQESHATETDRNGMINLLIGLGTQIGATSFDDVDWNGISKTLKVEIDFSGGSNYQVLSIQPLTYIPSPGGDDVQELSEEISSILATQAEQSAAIALNTAKVGITPEQLEAIENNTGSNTGDQDISGIVQNTSDIALLLAGLTSLNANTKSYIDGLLLQIGDPVKLLDAGYTLEQITGGSDVSAMIEAGFSVEQLINEGISTAALISAGVGGSELISAGVDATELIAGGATLAEAIASGASLTGLLADNTAAELLAAGASTYNLMQAGVTISTLLSAGVTSNQLYLAGVSIQELLDNNISVSTLNSDGISVANMISAGISNETLLSSGVSPAQMVSAGVATSTFIGMFYQAGAIVYIANDGSSGIISALTEATANKMLWGPTGQGINAANPYKNIGKGAEATARIIAQYGTVSTATAAGMCNNWSGGGYGDWYLPTEDEAKLFYTLKTEINACATANGGTALKGAAYWSSTDNNNATFARKIAMGNGAAGGNNKTNTTNNFVRAMRSF